MDNVVYFAFECLLVLVASRDVSSDITSCINEYCLTIPNAQTHMTFVEAQTWCTRNNSSTLFAIRNASAQQALTEFLSTDTVSDESFFINVRLFKSKNTWYLVNGDNYSGDIADQDGKDSSYKYYAFLCQHDQIAFKLTASNPTQPRNFICQYSQRFWPDDIVNGVNISLYSKDGPYYVKYENGTLTWFEARNRCKLNGGDLVTPTSINGFNATWLNVSQTYWVGIRWYNWQWKSPANGEETAYTHWSSGNPTTYSHECVCVQRNSFWNWSSCDCRTGRSFVCVKFTGVSSTTLRTSAVSSTSSYQTETTVTSTSGFSKKQTSSENLDIPIGVGVGVGGGVLLIIIVVVVVVIATKKRKSNQGTTERIKTSKDEANPKHKLTKPKDPKVVKKTDNFAVYADITPITQPIDREPTSGPIIYAYPEFVGSSV